MDWLTQKFELSRGDPGSNVRPMEGMRGFAVFLVFLVHYVTLIRPWVADGSALETFARAVHTIGNTGVDLFFVLSGYLIYGSLISKVQPYRQFLARRVRRIFPAFIVVFAIYIILSFVVPSQSKIPEPIVDAIIYLAANVLLLPGIFPIDPVITVAWSLSYEFFFYMGIPLLIAGAGLRRRHHTWRMGFFLATALGFGAYCSLFGGPIRLVMFFSGVLLYECVKNDVFRAPGSYVAFAALVLGLLTMLILGHGSAQYLVKVAVPFVSFFVLCFSCFMRPRAGLSRAFSYTPLRWLGNMSYSYYLLHSLALKAGFMVFAAVYPVASGGAGLFWTLLPLMFAMTLIPSALLYLLVERPLSLTPGKGRNSFAAMARARNSARDSVIQNTNNPGSA